MAAGADVAQCKGDEGLSATNVQGDFSVIGEEFVNFIATILTSRMAKRPMRQVFWIR